MYDYTPRHRGATPRYEDNVGQTPGRHLAVIGLHRPVSMILAVSEYDEARRRRELRWRPAVDERP